MATKPYIKLDTDWYDDPKVLDFQDRYGKAALVDLIKLFCVLGEFYGTIDLKDNAQKLRLQQVLGKKGKPLLAFLDKVSACALINEEAYRGIQRIGSDRSLKDGEARRKRKEYALVASQAAADKRNEDKAAP
ncbi:MAG: hypothetical protein IJ087_00065 [Eggerthellaceae bacterium]|nr:hypothetical protein [Eggerthellaceae bacterium]